MNSPETVSSKDHVDKIIKNKSHWISLVWKIV